MGISISRNRFKKEMNPSSSDKNDEENEYCSICFTRPKTDIVIPCCHRTICSICAKIMMKYSKQHNKIKYIVLKTPQKCILCPICNQRGVIFSSYSC